MGKLLLLTLNEQEEKMIDKIITAISDYIQIEPMEITPASMLSLISDIFFCPYGRLEALLWAVMGNPCLLTNCPEMPLKRFLLLFYVCICFPFSFFYKGLGNFPPNKNSIRHFS